jgi:hypothetical protein
MKFKVIEDFDAAGALKSRTFNEISKHFLSSVYAKFKELYDPRDADTTEARHLFYLAIQKALEDKNRSK